jgi:hypothetical protein
MLSTVVRLRQSAGVASRYEEALDQSWRKHPTSKGHAEECGASRQPAQRALEHCEAQVSRHQVAAGERCQGAILGQVRAKQYRRGLDARFFERSP